MNKMRAVIRYDFSRYGRIILIVYGWMIGLGVVLPIVISFINDGTKSLGKALNGGLVSLAGVSIFVNMGLLFYLGLLTYERFQFLIQNGVSRKTAWRGKWWILAFISVVATLYTCLIQLLLFNSGTESESTVPYLAIYGKFFTNGVVNIVMMFIVTLLFMMAVYTTGMLIGNILALVSKTRRRTILIASPIALIILSALYNRAGKDHLISFEGLNNFIKLIVGYNSKMGYFNPIIVTMWMLGWTVLMSGLSRLIDRKLQIKRGE